VCCVCVCCGACFRRDTPFLSLSLHMGTASWTHGNVSHRLIPPRWTAPGRLTSSTVALPPLRPHRNEVSFASPLVDERHSPRASARARARDGDRTAAAASSPTHGITAGSDGAPFHAQEGTAGALERGEGEAHGSRRGSGGRHGGTGMEVPDDTLPPRFADVDGAGTGGVHDDDGASSVGSGKWDDPPRSPAGGGFDVTQDIFSA